MVREIEKTKYRSWKTRESDRVRAVDPLSPSPWTWNLAPEAGTEAIVLCAIPSSYSIRNHPFRFSQRIHSNSVTSSPRAPGAGLNFTFLLVGWYPRANYQSNIYICTYKCVLSSALLWTFPLSDYSLPFQLSSTHNEEGHDSRTSKKGTFIFLLHTERTGGLTHER